ncbi:hypothetical protein CLAFUW4_05693 [Fulvia fulva]|uniref:DUF7730 domain-containing protein n=1 Tax=Passalora fulva TaxID=5499 RepID=A0A9Q8LID9_PASFU|nr:uncharacterized protein CLAFUR5_05835 [Fulvia fulva]KAK4624513.1 hypothetical protein CLAFUR4_05687 [Fulvia fulva]KAK4625033.1 hypothetical protein CLAFUR0_05697 [Fulvia fulva]UJO18201.1 hypothetical protein CLAFUR5_05835 [Fulvia fulva]WPV14570.1 hypothetical protein CLAFUW4_05693 [Fulvia fulva]WPV30556.1 hypothetical protein CLAFUW7_05691 [Fulvia fulva]
MDSCTLWKLPPELREQIYAHVFTPGPEHNCYLSKPRLQIRSGNVYLKPSTLRSIRKSDVNGQALLRTCNTIYAEALPVFYGFFEFDCEINDSPENRNSQPFHQDDINSAFNMGRLENCALIQHMRHLRLIIDQRRLHEVPLLQRRLELFIDALQTNGKLNVWLLALNFYPETSDALGNHAGYGDPIAEVLGRLKVQNPVRINIHHREAIAASRFEMLMHNLNGVDLGGMAGRGGFINIFNPDEAVGQQASCNLSRR